MQRIKIANIIEISKFYDKYPDILDFVKATLEKYSFDELIKFYSREGYFFNLTENLEAIKYINIKTGLPFREILEKLDFSFDLEDLIQLLNIFSPEELLIALKNNTNNIILNSDLTITEYLANLYNKTKNDKIKEFTILILNILLKKNNINYVVSIIKHGSFFIDIAMEYILNNLNDSTFKKVLNSYFDVNYEEDIKNKILLNEKIISFAINKPLLLKDFFERKDLHINASVIFKDKNIYNIYSYILFSYLLNNQKTEIKEPSDFVEINSQKDKIISLFKDAIDYQGLKKAIIESKNKIFFDYLFLLKIPINEFNVIFNDKKNKIISINEKESIINTLKVYGEDNPAYILYNKNNILLQYVIENNINTIGVIIKFFKEYMMLFNKTVDSIYHDSLKQNPFVIDAISKFSKDKLDVFIEFDKVEKNVKLINVQNFNQFVKLQNRKLELAQSIHNSSIDDEYISKLFNNLKLDLEEDYVDNLLEVLKFNKNKEQNIEKIKLIEGKFKQHNFDLDIDNLINLLNKYDQFIDQFNNYSLSPTSEFVRIGKELGTYASYAEMYDAVIKYIDQAKPKDKNLFKLNLEFDDFEFKVLKDVDPLHFRIGIETDCCQRIGGAGEDAAVDSFINPWAGVLALYKNSKLLSQSYFHYVPSENGYILDNVEYNENEVKKYDNNIKDEQSHWLATIYKKYGQLIKQKYPNIKYIKLGKSWSKIPLSLFEPASLEDDPRIFATPDTYTDFDYNDHVNII
jgi:hypothetical protein